MNFKTVIDRVNEIYTERKRKKYGPMPAVTVQSDSAWAIMTAVLEYQHSVNNQLAERIRALELRLEGRPERDIKTAIVTPLTSPGTPVTPREIPL